ncbi:MAG: hypothetical protein WA151_01190 [Desulfatirhabdiaceae bacterium]
MIGIFLVQPPSLVHIVEYVEELETSTAGMIVLNETAGLEQVYRRALVDPVSLLERHYHPEAGNGR